MWGGMGNKDSEENEKAAPPGGAMIVSDVFYYELRDSKGNLKSFQGKKLKKKNRLLALFERLLGIARV